MLAKRSANENRGNVGTHGQQVIDQLRYAFVIQTCQRFQNIQTGGFPEIVHFCRFAMLDSEPAIPGKSLQHFTQCGTSDANQFRELAFSRKNRPRRKATIPDTFDDVLFRETRRALRLNDHIRFP